MCSSDLSSTPAAATATTEIYTLSLHDALPILVLATLDIGTALLLLSGLSFLGLGAKPPSPEWGAMVSSGVEVFDSWWVATFPGLAILTVVLAFNFLGDTLRDALDPRTARAIKERAL